MSLPAQGIQCGTLNLAFPYAWAKSIVEDFHLTPVPNAPAWLIGAANVEGEIVPVFDLASWAAAGEPDATTAAPVATRTRLLIGGQGGDRAAIVFSGSARMVRYVPAGPSVADLDALPARLRSVVLARSEADPPHWVADGPRLFDQLANDLAS